ncbi:hypothetical protein PV326_002982 [Microctonus aethiopoides]|nr:hypothetical protein PV326_002982 [Microctonus aethiopoides]
MGVVGGECAVKGTGGKNYPCHCCSSQVPNIGSAPGTLSVLQLQQINQNRRQSRGIKSSNIEPELPTCNPNSPTTTATTDHNILAPLKSKMKVLKKLKRKMGLGEEN